MRKGEMWEHLKNAHMQWHKLYMVHSTCGVKRQLKNDEIVEEGKEGETLRLRYSPGTKHVCICIEHMLRVWNLGDAVRFENMRVH